MKRILLFCIIAMFASACAETPEILYRGLLFGYMTGPETMHGDDERDYHFTNIEDDMGLPSEGRVVALFYATSQTPGKENAYEAELISFSTPAYKNPVLCTSIEESEALGTDPVELADGYFGGGCLNLVCNAYFGPIANVKHVINLAVDNSTPSDTLRLTLRHDAGDDHTDSIDTSDMTVKSFYASFPMGDLMPEGREKVVVFNWYWNDGWHQEIRTYKR